MRYIAQRAADGGYHVLDTYREREPCMATWSLSAATAERWAAALNTAYTAFLAASRSALGLDTTSP